MTEHVEELDHIAIVGMAGRFPGAPTVEDFWKNLREANEAISFFTVEELVEAGHSRALVERENYVKAKGVLTGADLFDADFFGLTPREAELLDPQHRVFLECAWEALEAAGCDPYTYDGRIGVFAGASFNTYLVRNILPNPAVLASVGEFQTLLANDKDFLATRVSYKLNLRGPSVTVQTACSTSLSAVHLACQSLLNGECDIAIAGGVAVGVPEKAGYLYDEGGIVSSDGHCRPFDASSTGTLGGNGVGIVVLRRLLDAQGSDDDVVAVIRGTAMNNDGSLKVGYTAPSVRGQSEVIAEALAVAGVDASTVGYVEAHGTGTALGDPIEVTALTAAFRTHTDLKGFCALGAVKSNVGHLDAAAGVTGLIKAVSALRNQEIPATLNFSEPNPELRLEDTPFYVNAELSKWPRGEQPRRAGVSAFGIGGTNVHIVLEEAPVPTARIKGATPAAVVLPLSARTPQAVADAAARLAEHLESHPDLDFIDVAHTLSVRRRAFGSRLAVACRDREEAVLALRQVSPGQVTPEAHSTRPVAFVFPGQGAQYVAMGRGLYEQEPVFAAELDRCAELFVPNCGVDLRSLIYGGQDSAEEAAARLQQTAVTQPALFAVEYALAQLWRSWGVEPVALLGHSIGEYVAACLAGVFTLEDAVRIVATRGRLVQAMPAGAMLAVMQPEMDVAELLDDALCIAVVNSAAMCVVSGPVLDVGNLQQRLESRGVPCRPLHTSHAFHSPAMDGAVGPLVDELRKTSLHAPTIPFLSNLTGTWITPEQATDPSYWGGQLRGAVRFADGLTRLLADPDMLLIEAGPGQALTAVAHAHPAWDEGRMAIPSLPAAARPKDDVLTARSALGRVWAAGVAVDWSAVLGDGGRQVALPGYPFQRQRYWIEARATAPSTELPSEPTGPQELVQMPGWKRMSRSTNGTGADAAGTTWLLLGAELGLGVELADRLDGRAARVVKVTASGGLTSDGDAWTVDPTDRQHFTQLFTALADAGTLHVVHAWSCSEEYGGGLDAVSLAAGRRLGFDSLVALTQGFGDAATGVATLVDVVTDGVFEVTGEESLRPVNALVTGAALVMPQETEDLSCRTIDISGVDVGTPVQAGVDRLLTLMLMAPGAHEMALRGQHGWQRDYEAVALSAPEHDMLRDGGVYLITGGLGGVGLALAEHLAERVSKPVLGLLGRSPVPLEADWDNHLASSGDDPLTVRLRRLATLRDRGATVVPLTADITDLQQTRAAVSTMTDRYGAVNGVIHAAGLPSRGLLVNKTTRDIDEVLAAKTTGTLVLDQVVDFDSCDLVLLCSSLSSILGGPGQSDYSAANAFLGVFAEERQQRTGAPVVAVEWDTWRGIGMATGLAAQLRDTEPGRALSGHPLLERIVRTAESSRTYLTTFDTATSWIVDEHRIMDHGLVPGTAYLELVCAAVNDDREGQVGRAEQVMEAHNVFFTQPVIVPDGAQVKVYTTIEPQGEALRFVISSRDDDGARVEHCTGTVTFREKADEANRDLDELRAACAATRVLQTEADFKKHLKLASIEDGGDLQFTFGPRWRRSLRRIEVGKDLMIATLTLPQEYQGDLDEYSLHPALLDLAGAAARIVAPDVYYMPLMYAKLEMFAPLTSTVHCAIWVKGDHDGETMSCDLEVFDPPGRLLVRITDLTIKRIGDVAAMLEQIRTLAAARTEPARQSSAGEGPLALLTAGLEVDEACGSFDRIVAAVGLPARVAVSSKDVAAMRRLAQTITPALVAEQAGQLAPLGGQHPRPDLDTEYVAARNQAEEVVAGIWQEVLGIERVGVLDDYFELGGHSLAAVQIGAKIKTHFGVELGFRSLFDDPTIAGTVEKLAQPPTAGAADAIPVLDRNVEGFLAEGAPGHTQDDLDGLTDDEVEARLAELLALADTAEDTLGSGESSSLTTMPEVDSRRAKK